MEINRATLKDKKTKYDKEKIKNILKKTLVGTGKNLFTISVISIVVTIIFSIFSLLDYYLGAFAGLIYVIVLMVFFVNLIKNLE